MLPARNPTFGGPVSEGARSFIQDIGLNVFIAVLAANVGSKVLASFQGTTVIWLATSRWQTRESPCASPST